MSEAEEARMDWQRVNLAEWPHGVRCMDCGSPLVDGAVYVERIEGFVEDTPVTEIVCLSCGGVS